MTAKKVLNCKNEAFFVVSQLQSISFVLAGFFNLWCHEKASTAIVKPIRKGLAVAIQEKLVAKLLLPANKAMTGVIQQSEAAMAEKTPVVKNVLFDSS